MMAVGRSGGRAVRTAIAAWIVLTCGAPDRLTAQVSLHLAAGARYSSMLVHDSIVTPVDLQPAIAPAVLVTARTPLRGAWVADVTLDVSPSGLRRREPGGSFDAGSVTTAAFTVGLERRLPFGAGVRAGIGGLRYLGNDAGVFREGSGGLFPTATLAATFAPAAGARRRLEVELRYDVHRFLTPALRTEGFTDPRFVHRVALLVRLGVAGARIGATP